MTRGPSKQFDIDIALSKAMDVFWSRGYEAASLSSLTRSMNIGKKSLYDTFGNKQALFLKALEHYVDITLKEMREQLFADGSPLSNVKDLLRQWQALQAKPGSCGCMLGTNIADFNTDDEAIAKIMRTYLRRTEDMFTSALTKAKSAGELSDETNPRHLAALILCTIHGIALLGRVMNEGDTLEGAVSAAIALLERS
ncbi:MAG: TetR/AcrR family transcriptional regulator [Cyanobacteria bacterium P01_D01_bin.105]